MDEVMRWSQATIDWTKGDPTKGNLVVGSPLAVAMAGRGLARNWFGHAGRHEDLNDAVAFAEQTREPLILAMVMSWKYGMGLWNRVFRADDAVARAFESALQTVEALGDDYAVVMMQNLLAGALLIRRAEGDRDRGRELLVQTRNVAIQQQYLGSELPLLDVYVALEQARDGDSDGAIAELRKSVADMTARGQVRYYIPAVGAFVETLLDRGTDTDLAEAENVVARLASASAEGSVIRDIWLLRARAAGAGHRRQRRLRRPSRPLSRDGDRSRLRGPHGLGRGDALTSWGPRSRRPGDR